MKEQSWWSNNLLPLSVVLLVFCGLTAAAVGFMHWASTALKPQARELAPVDIEKRMARKRAADVQAASWGVYTPYMHEIQRDIKTHWHPPKGDKSRRVTVMFKVDRQGNLSNLKVSPTGDDALDQSARQAVEDTAPFPHLPFETKDKDVDIQFTFDYNVYGKSRSLIR